MPVQFTRVADEAEAERIRDQERRTYGPAWEEITSQFLATGERFLLFDPKSDERLVKSGENGDAVLTAGSVASSVNSYAKNRNLGVKANATGEGLVQLSRVEVEGEPREPAKRGRKAKP